MQHSATQRGHPCYSAVAGWAGCGGVHWSVEEEAQGRAGGLQCCNLFLWHVAFANVPGGATAQRMKHNAPLCSLHDTRGERGERGKPPTSGPLQATQDCPSIGVSNANRCVWCRENVEVSQLQWTSYGTLGRSGQTVAMRPATSVPHGPA